MKINPERMAGKTGGRSLALMLAGLAAMASFRANATFTESKLNDIAVKNDGGSIIVYHAGTGGNPSAAFDGNKETFYENGDCIIKSAGWALAFRRRGIFRRSATCRAAVRRKE